MKKQQKEQEKLQKKARKRERRQQKKERKQQKREQKLARKQRKQAKRKRRGTTVRFKVASTFTLFTAALLILLNVYPIIVSRDTVVTTKQSAMQSQGSVISSSLSALEVLTSESVEQVMELLDVTPVTRMIITDQSGLILYDTSEDDTTGRYALLSEVADALSGYTVFYCAYSEGVFVSRSATPVSSGGAIVGAVYLYEYDSEQGEIIVGLQRNLRNMSVLFGGAGLIIITILSSTLTRRIKRLSKAMNFVRGGDYAYRISVQGNDELAVLSEEFNILTGRLESTEEIRRRFVSDASHELRTPLAAIRLLADSITQAENMDMATVREFAQDIGSEADRLQRTTEKLMSLTKLDAGVTQLQQEPVDVKLVARRTLHLLEPLAAKQQISLRTRLSDDCIVKASADDLYQIIFNLVENAIKYNVQNGDVTLSLRRERATVILTVEDTGIGIPEEDIGHVFERFYRVDKARSRASGGSGLGLSIVHDAVVANGGEIEVARREESGTCFTVTFPLCPKKERRP
ncbi:MAG: HAMP domain-containing histidine kinase [Oscillospiraceae bacterium]|nr:HAMP domain-containing histidine kinase [Oscillospiraceae bacterium]